MAKRHSSKPRVGDQGEKLKSEAEAATIQKLKFEKLKG
jgi:hypothetical protein